MMMARAIPAARAEKLPILQDYEPVDKDADDDGRNAGEDVGGEADNVPQAVTSVFGQEDAGTNPDGNAYHGREADDDEGADHGVGNTATRLALGHGHLCEQVDVERADAFGQHKPQDQDQHPHRKEGEDGAKAQHKGIRRPAALVRCDAHSRITPGERAIRQTSSRATMFTKRVIASRINASSTRAEM